MDDFALGLLLEDLKKATLKIHKDKAVNFTTYLDCEDVEYRVIIEKVGEK